VASYRWFHTIDLGRGIATPGVKSAATLTAEAAESNRIEERGGRSFLDIGAWNGYFSFAAHRRGATPILATDSFCWTEPMFKGLETFQLCRQELGIAIDDQTVDVDDLPDRVTPHDVVLFAGVFYHRIEPVRALAAAARVARHCLIVETHQDAIDISRPAMIFYPGTTLNGDPTNWWGPNPQCVAALLRAHGFEAIYYRDGPLPESRRGIFHAFKSRAAAAEMAPGIERIAQDLTQVAPPETLTLERRILALEADLERLRSSRSTLARQLVRAIVAKMF
jgi:tRNA (mo5U34)-methyltransferase